MSCRARCLPVVLALAALVAVAAAAVRPGAAQAAPWCGTTSPTDRPAVVAGPQIHVVYMIAADGIDGSAEWGPHISADIDEIEDWWLGHDGSHVPRFDRTPFGCGNQADIQVIRLPQRVGELTSVSDTSWVFERVVDAIEGQRGFTRGVKYLVYLDIRMQNDQVCGVGAGGFDTAGLATVLLHNCEDVSTTTVAVHELLHAMGGNPKGPTPNACPGDTAHVCDSTGDILAPYAEYARLAALGLDVGNNDYYAHGGTWSDLQDSRWLHEPGTEAPVAVRVTGSGRVKSADGFLDCATACSIGYARGTRLGLVAEAEPGSRFFRWNGSCTGTSSGCDFDTSGPVDAEAVFGPATLALNLKTAGQGRILVTGKPSLTCSGTCAKTVPSVTPVVLTPSAARGWRFSAWAGACTGARPTCRVPMTAAASVRAVFVKTKAKA